MRAVEVQIVLGEELLCGLFVSQFELRFNHTSPFARFDGFRVCTFTHQPPYGTKNDLLTGTRLARNDRETRMPTDVQPVNQCIVLNM